MSNSSRRRAVPFAVAAAAIVAIMGTAAPSLAQDGDPFVEGSISFEVQNDHIFDSDDPSAEINDLYTTIEPALTFHILPGLTLEAGVVLEPVRDPDPFEDRYFEDLGLYAETLFLQYADDRFAVYGGKYNPPFGVAWDLAPGLYGADFAEDYELTERIGFGGSFTFGGDSLGSHTLSANAFFVDTSFLSGSIITDRGQTHLSDGGPSNTGDPASFSLTLDGGEMPFAPNFGYHLGVTHQEAGRGDLDDLLGVVGALYAGFDLADGVTLEPLVEVAWFEDVDSLLDDRLYVTAGAALSVDAFTLSGSYTGRTTYVAGGPDVEDSLAQGTLEYGFENGLGVALGYKWAEEGGVESHTVGALVSYELEFAAP